MGGYVTHQGGRPRLRAKTSFCHIIVLATTVTYRSEPTIGRLTFTKLTSRNSMSLHSHVDLAFPVRGRAIPRDHGYALYGAVNRLLPSVHGATWIGIHGIAAKLANSEELTLEPMGTLRVRVPTDKIGELLALAGATLDVAGRRVEVGAPTVQTLTPAATLDARIVVIRLTGGLTKPFDPAVFEQRFVAEAQRQLVAHEIRGDLELCGRQSLSVGGQRVIGHSLRVLGLSPDDSLKLQIHGLGGKRTMGCGIFRPARIKVKVQQVA
jgi:CRISPR-associated protein Cas6